jgi:hypothetical protein
MRNYMMLSGLILVGFLSSQVHAKSITLSPHETKPFANNTLFVINAQCIVRSTNQCANKIKISVLKSKGVINGKNVSTGHVTTVSLKNDATMHVSADSGMEINLTNLSDVALQVICST